MPDRTRQDERPACPGGPTGRGEGGLVTRASLHGKYTQKSWHANLKFLSYQQKRNYCRAWFYNVMVLKLHVGNVNPNPGSQCDEGPRAGN